MSDPRRLHEDADVPEFDRALLQAARLDREPEDGAARALLALGLGAGASALIAGEGSAAPAAAKGASVLGMSTATKSVIGLALLSGIVLALRVAAAPAVAPPPTRLQSMEPATTPVPLVAASVESHHPVETPPRTPVAEATISVVDLPAAKVAAPARPAPAAPPTSARVEPKAEAKEPSVSEEIALIDRARTALAAGDPAAAERALDDHDARFERGMLALESKVARIELLVGRGDANGARALAERFLAEHPRSAYENRVRGLLRRLVNPDSNLNFDSNSR